MGYQATFNFAQWAQLFPEFASVPQDVAQGYFDTATTIFRNDGTSPAPTAAFQLQVLNWLTAHICQLFYTAPGAQPSQLVGRISDATEGSVTVKVELPVASLNQAWFTQTKYGLMYWQMTAVFRSFRFVPPPATFVDPWTRGGPYGGSIL